MGLELTMGANDHAGLFRHAQLDGQSRCKFAPKREYVAHDLYQSFTDYATDVTAAWTFYTPTYGIIEYFAGMDSKEIMKARGMSLVVHAAIGRPVGKLRNILADK